MATDRTYRLTCWDRWYVDTNGLLQRRPEFPTDDSMRWSTNGD